MKGVADACTSTWCRPREPWDTPRQPRRRSFRTVAHTDGAATVTMSARLIRSRGNADWVPNGPSLVTSWYIAKVLSAARLVSALYSISFPWTLLHLGWRDLHVRRALLRHSVYVPE